MVVRVALIGLILCIGATEADAKSRRTQRPQAVRISPLEATSMAVRQDRAARLANWRAARWSLGNQSAYDDGSGDGVQLRWRLNKVKLKAPINLSMN